MKTEDTRRASPAAAVPEGALPPLPDQVLEDLMHKHDLIGVAGDNPNWEAKLIAFARAAVEADRARLTAAYEAATSLAAETINARNAEIAKLRAALADRAQQGEPVAADDETEPQWWFDLHAAAAALEDFGATGNAMSVCKIANQLLTATKAASPADAPKWGPVHTVGDMVRNLLTLDQSEPIFTAFHVDFQSERRCRTRPVSISRERVIDGKWIDSSRKDVPYAHVIWAKPDERAAPAPDTGTPTAGEVAAAHALLEQKWDSEGDCRSCGWHAALCEHYVDDDDIIDALQRDGVLHLSCMNKDDEDRDSHRGISINVRTPVSTTPTSGEAEKAGAPTCWCHECNKGRIVNGFPYSMTTMILCPTCGNKRCPHANDHRNACTGSNEPGQPGGAYSGPSEAKAGESNQ